MLGSRPSGASTEPESTGQRRRRRTAGRSARHLLSALLLSAVLGSGANAWAAGAAAPTAAGEVATQPAPLSESTSSGAAAPSADSASAMSAGPTTSGATTSGTGDSPPPADSAPPPVVDPPQSNDAGPTGDPQPETDLPSPTDGTPTEDTDTPPPDPEPGPQPGPVSPEPGPSAGCPDGSTPPPDGDCPPPVCPDGSTPVDGECAGDVPEQCSGEEGAHSHPPAGDPAGPSPQHCGPGGGTGGPGEGEPGGSGDATEDGATPGDVPGGGGRGDVGQPGSREGAGGPQVVCWDGSTRPSAEECPVERTQCPGGSVSVPVGEPCPAPEPTPAPPVACWDGSEAPTTFDCPPGRTFCPGGVTVPLGEQCPPTEPEIRCAAGTVRVLGVCTPVVPEDAPQPKNGAPLAREAEPGELLFDRHVVSGAEELYARGAGCEPGAEATLTSDGELVGRTVADQDGRFETGVHFGSFRPGYREVTASCGVELTGGIEMVLVAADTGASATSVLLPFFLALGFLAVHYQSAARGRRRSRARRPS